MKLISYIAFCYLLVLSQCEGGQIRPKKTKKNDNRHVATRAMKTNEMTGQSSHSGIPENKAGYGGQDYDSEEYKSPSKNGNKKDKKKGGKKVGKHVKTHQKSRKHKKEHFKKTSLRTIQTRMEDKKEKSKNKGLAGKMKTKGSFREKPQFPLVYEKPFVERKEGKSKKVAKPKAYRTIKASGISPPTDKKKNHKNAFRAGPGWSKEHEHHGSGEAIHGSGGGGGFRKGKGKGKGKRRGKGRGKGKGKKKGSYSVYSGKPSGHEVGITGGEDLAENHGGEHGRGHAGWHDGKYGGGHGGGKGEGIADRGHSGGYSDGHVGGKGEGISGGGGHKGKHRGKLE